MKDECGGEPIEEVVALRPKMYSIKKVGSNIKKAKGVKKNVETVHAQNEDLAE